MFAKAQVAVRKCVGDLRSSSAQQQRAVALSLFLLTVYFSGGLGTQVGTILKLSTI